MIWKINTNAVLPKITNLKAALEDQLQQREISYLPTPLVKPLEDKFELLKETERLFTQVINDTTNVKDIRTVLTRLTQLTSAAREQQLVGCPAFR